MLDVVASITIDRTRTVICEYAHVFGNDSFSSGTFPLSECSMFPHLTLWLEGQDVQAARSEVAFQSISARRGRKQYCVWILLAVLDSLVARISEAPMLQWLQAQDVYFRSRQKRSDVQAAQRGPPAYQDDGQPVKAPACNELGNFGTDTNSHTTK